MFIAENHIYVMFTATTIMLESVWSLKGLTVFWVILSIDKITVKLKDSWK